MSEELPTVRGRLTPGAMLEGYRCEEEIGRGGMAVVYRAYDDHLDRRVALKVLAPELARDEVFRARFTQESRIAAATEHPHIIPVFAAGEADGMLYIAMRYVPDGDVRALIDRVGPLPAARACALIAQAASALDAAHARGLVHRDVKPTNMLLEISTDSSQPDHLYLSDFGLAKPSAAASGLTMTGQFFGTVDYVAPEQIQGQPLDGRADQYALACTSFEMLSGQPPFKRENGMAVISAQLSEPPPSLTALRPDLPAAVDRVIAKAMAKSRSDRYERCFDFAEALTAACRPGAAGRGPAVAGVPHPPTQLATPPAPATVAGPGAASSPPAAGPAYPPPAMGSGFPPPPAGQQPYGPDTLGFLAGQPIPAGPAGRNDPGRPPRRRSRGAAFALGVAAAAIVLFCAAAGATYLLLHRTSSTGPSAAGSSAPAPPATSAAAGTPSASASSGATQTPVPPPNALAATVREYYGAINHHRYALAWRLGGRNTGSTYPAFVNGFATTAHDAVAVQSVSGDLVTAQVTAEQTNGTVKTYQGTYTVTSGVITQFNVRQTS
jgi:tRNA A-37 threonylcarbamoyl transferase component Bud32